MYLFTIFIGGPHVGDQMIWPMSIIMRAFTSDDDNEILECLEALKSTTAGTGKLFIYLLLLLLL